MQDLSDIIRLTDEQGRAFSEFKARYDERLSVMEKEISKKLLEMGRPGFSDSTGGDAEYKNAFLRYIRTGRDSDLEKKYVISGSEDPAGGYLVPEQIDRELTKVLRELSSMRKVARVIKVDSPDFGMVHSVGGTGYAWAGETDDREGTATPNFQKIKPPMGEIYAIPTITQHVLDDNTFELESWLISELTEAFDAGEGDAFINGNGVVKPRGILTYDIASTADGTRSDNALQYVASGASGAFAGTDPADKLVKLVHALKPRYRQGASWLMNTNTLEQVRILKDGNDNYLWRAGLEAGRPDMLLGYPVFEDESMPDISANSLSIAFGNFMRGYTILDRSTTMVRDPYTLKGFVQLYTARRVGGAMRDFRAVKLMKFAAS